LATLTTQHNKGLKTELYHFTQGIDVDARLAAHEIRVQKAWALQLKEISVLSAEELGKIHGALDEASVLISKGEFEWKEEDEDVHMNLERFVTERAGALGKKMHLGRSRNDLIATTLRLFVADQATEISKGLRTLIEALTARAELDADVLVPGLTHLQHGQPVRHGHTLAAHAWAFVRDQERLKQVRARALEAMPLGSAALSGTTLPIQLGILAQSLGFSGPPRNSFDAVGDRDFMNELLAALALLGTHFSRLAEDCIYWSSTAVALVKLPPEWSTGSSIMPNKRNPDVPELVRGKSSHLIAASANGLTLMKSVPTSYGSDLHELKSVVLRSLDETKTCLSVLPGFIRGMEPNRKRAAELLTKGQLLATEVADELAARGVPFREAYAISAALVERAESAGVQIQALPAEVWAATAPQITRTFLSSLSFENAVERRNQTGGTSLTRFQEQLKTLKNSAL
jgi:argininosuccinate lyase